MAKFENSCFAHSCQGISCLFSKSSVPAERCKIQGKSFPDADWTHLQIPEAQLACAPFFKYISTLAASCLLRGWSRCRRNQPRPNPYFCAAFPWIISRAGPYSENKGPPTSPVHTYTLSAHPSFSGSKFVCIIILRADIFPTWCCCWREKAGNQVIRGNCWCIIYVCVWIWARAHPQYNCGDRRPRRATITSPLHILLQLQLLPLELMRALAARRQATIYHCVC